MGWHDGLRHRLRTLFRPEAHADELAEEMRLHLELEAMQRGDHDAARRAFGNVTRLQEDTRDLTWLRARDLISQDLGASWRAVWREPASSLLIVVMLALGIGANAGVFSLADRLYVRPPSGVAAPEDLRRVWLRHFRTGDGVPFTSLSFSYPMAREASAELGGLQNTGLYLTDFALRLGREPGGPRVRGVYASATYFEVLGVRAARGRVYAPDEDTMGRGARVAVISDAFWKTQLSADSRVLGRSLVLGRETYTIVGVLPPEFTGLDLAPGDVWIPLASMPDPLGAKESWWEGTDVNGIRLAYRASPATSEPQLEQAMTTRLRRWGAATHGLRSDTLLTAYTGSIIEARGPSRGPSEDSPSLSITTRLVGVAALVLLIAWANTGNLLLARAARRRREVALRLALGISRVRLARVLALEALWLAAGAALVAAVLATATGIVLRRLLLPDLTWDGGPFDFRVLLFTLGIGVLSAIIATVIPARQSAAATLMPGLLASSSGGGLSRSRLRPALVGVQTALSVLLLTGAMLFVRSLRKVAALDLGYDADQLVMATASYEPGQAPPRAAVVASARAVVSGLAMQPGVEAVSRAGMEPMQGLSFREFYTERDSTGSYPGREPTALDVAPGFFATVGLRILRGTGFSTADVDSGPAEVVVNAAMAKLVWPSEDAVGQCLRFGSRTARCYTVVGVAENSRQSYVLEPDARAMYYVSLGNQPTPGPAGRTVIARVGKGKQTAVMLALRRQMTQAFPSATIAVSSMNDLLEPEYRPWRVGATLFSALGLLALLVAALGVYGTVSCSVQERTREHGVRQALGANAARIVREVVGNALPEVGVGVGIGAVLSLAAAPMVAALLYGVSPRDRVTLVAVSLGVLLVAALACIAPAWRAARVDPVVALRAD